MRFGVEEVAEREGCRCRQEQPIEGRVTAGAFASKSMPILDHVRVCDCSICKRRGALIHRVEPKFLRLLTPLDDLGVYTFHTHVARDYFCRTCGILPFKRPRTAADVWGVNVRCPEGVDLDD